MKILHYTGVYAPAWKWGGPPRSSANLAEGAAALGHEVTVFTTNAGLENDSTIPTNRSVQRNGVKVHYFPARASFLGLRSRELEQAVESQVREFDVVHITGVWQPTTVAACRACYAAGVPYVVSPRGALSPYSFTQKPWKKWPYWWLHERRNCDRAAVIHYTATMEREESFRLRLRPLTVVVPNAIDLSAWKRDVAAGNAWRVEMEPRSVSADAKILLYAGRLHHKKGLDLLPGALRLVTHDNWHLVLVGDDEDGAGAALKSAMAKVSLADRVTFLPATDSAGLRSAYSGADLFLLPSRHENFGNVAVEALACGCPIIISDGVGVGFEINKFKGVTIVPREESSWARAIENALVTKNVPIRQDVVDCFSCAAIASEMINAYKIATGGGTRNTGLKSSVQ